MPWVQEHGRANGTSLPDGRKRGPNSGGGDGMDEDSEAENEPRRPSKQPWHDGN